jgi:hypothetical protein
MIYLKMEKCRGVMKKAPANPGQTFATLDAESVSGHSTHEVAAR